MSTLRYVVLFHDGVEVPHFDLMFETAPGSALMTFRSAVWPITAPAPVERLPDHRRAYLEYEGPVSNDRGAVRRVAQGTYASQHRRDAPAVLDLTLFGPTPVTFRLSPSSRPDAWTIEPAVISSPPGCTTLHAPPSTSRCDGA